MKHNREMLKEGNKLKEIDKDLAKRQSIAKRDLNVQFQNNEKQIENIPLDNMNGIQELDSNHRYLVVYLS